MGILSTLVGPRTWEPPAFEMPMLTMASDLKELGRDRGGRRWFSHKKYGECIEGQLIDATQRALPDGVLVEVGADRFRSFGSWSAPGTYERLMNTKGRAPIQPKPHRPVDAIAHLHLAASRPERIYASVQAINGRPAEPVARGPVEILGRLERAGATVRLSTDGAALVVETSGGMLAPGVLEVVDRTAPMLVAHLNGSSLACTVSRHKSPAPATTYALGGAPWCGECGGAK